MAKAHIEYPGETKQTLPSLLCLGNLASLPERDRLNCVEFWSEITWLSHPGDGDVTQWTGERGLGRFPSPIHLMILLSTTILVCSLLDFSLRVQPYSRWVTSQHRRLKLIDFGLCSKTLCSAGSSRTGGEFGDLQGPNSRTHHHAGIDTSAFAFLYPGD